MESTAANLAQRIINHDPGGFSDVMAWYGNDVLRLCYFLLHDRREAEDVYQETLLTLVRWLKEEKFHPENGSIKNFLLHCARNRCIDRLRKKKRLQPMDETEKEIWEAQPDPTTPDRILDQTRLQEAFDSALSQLPDAHRVSLVLYELRGESYKQIAETLHISVDAIKKNIYRARKKLRILLAPYRDGL
jgi:RNA polymerase sigma-70 factor, ECF subfamily